MKVFVGLTMVLYTFISTPMVCVRKIGDIDYYYERGLLVPVNKEGLTTKERNKRTEKCILRDSPVYYRIELQITPKTMTGVPLKQRPLVLEI